MLCTIAGQEMAESSDTDDEDDDLSDENAFNSRKKTQGDTMAEEEKMRRLRAVK